MRPIDGTELALWLQKQFRPQISSDVAKYVAEFDEFRGALDEKTDRERGAYLDIPKNLRHQWEMLAPSDVRAGRMATFPVQVQSDLGPMVIGTYRAMVGPDRRIEVSEDTIEWIPNFERGFPVPRRPDDPAKIGTKRKDSTEGLGGFVGMLVSIADAIEERAEGVAEILEVGEYTYEARASREMPIHRSTRDAIGKRAGSVAKNAIKNHLTTPWQTGRSFTTSQEVYTWLKRDARQPKWLTDLPNKAQDLVWKAISMKGIELYTWLAQNADKKGETAPTEREVWNFIAYYLQDKVPGFVAQCSKWEKVIKLDEEGVCKLTSCSLHPTQTRGISLGKTCEKQRIKASR